MRVIAAIPAVGLLAGTAAGLVAPDTPRAVLVAALVALTALACALSLTAAPIPRARPALPAFPALSVLVIAATFAAGGMLLAIDAWDEAWQPSLRVAFERGAGDASDPWFDEVGEGRGLQAEITGVLRTDAIPRETGASLLVDVNAIARAQDGSRGPAVPVRGGVAISVAGELAGDRLAEWRAGRTVRLPVQLRRPSRYLNPGVADAERSLARQGTTLVGSVKSALLVEVVSSGGRVSEAAAAVRAAIRRSVARSVGAWSDRSAGIVAAIVVGDRTGLAPDVQRRLQEAGTYHVIAISGGNIAILTGLLLGIFRLAGWLNRTAMLVAVLGLIGYALVVGAGGGRSVERATLMAIVYLAGRALDLRGAPGNALALVVALLLAAEPLAVGDPGFLLTCGATAAILVVVPAVQQWPVPRLVRPAVMLLAASIAAEVILMPVGSAFFSRVTFAGLALNFAAVPLMALAQVAGMAVLPASLIGLGQTAGGLAHLGAEGLVRSADLVEYAPWITWRVAPPSAPTLAIYYCCVGASWWMWRGRAARRVDRTSLPRLVRAGAALAAAGAASWILAEPWTLIATRGQDRLRIVFLDVGQGDATLVRFPRGDAMLVDAGGFPTGPSTFDIGDRVVAPVLRHHGIRRLGTAVVSHAHPDHAGGLPAILREFRPRDVWDGVPVPRLLSRLELLGDAAAVRARWATVQRDDRLLVDGVEVVVRHPPLPDWERQDVRNDDSVVLELRWGGVSVVLPGDIGREVEREIAGAFEPAAIRVLKVPHHGSLTSSSPVFLDALSPAIAVVSAGRGNTFGHPAPGVIERYEERGVRVFRTDRDGAVTLETDGQTLVMTTYTGSRSTYGSRR